MACYDELKPLYSIIQYTDSVYKIIKFRRSDGIALRLIEDEAEAVDGKFDSAISRARKMVFEYAMCNPWDWFFTGTLDASKYDRYNLEKFHSDFTGFVKYCSRKYGSKISFLFVPEKHENGAWHIHGLLHGLPDNVVTRFTKQFFESQHLKINYKLSRNELYNWFDYYKKFGFCSLSRVRSPIGCSYYITKYISEDIATRKGDRGEHLYYVSRGLNRAVKAADVYSNNIELDELLTNHFQFCDTGMAFNKDWLFPCECGHFEICSLVPYEYNEGSADEVVLLDKQMSIDFENCVIEGFR